MSEKILRINSNKLKNAMSKIVSIVSKKSNRPILSNSLFKFENNILEILSTDLDISAKVIIECQTENHVGNFCLNTKNISDILRELPNCELTLKINVDEKILNLEANNIKYTLLMVSSNDFPEISFEKNLSHSFNITSKDLKDLIHKTAYAMSTDETRMFLNGIYLHNNENKLRAVAIDGHRLALVDKEINLSESFENGIIIPRKGVSELKKMSEVEDGNIEISFSQSFLIASINDSYYVSVRLISREYPKYTSVIPNKSKNTVEFERDELMSAIKRIKILSNETTNGIKLHFTNNHIHLRANNEIYGEAQEEVNSKYEGDDIQMSLNASYLLETLSVLNEESVMFEISNSRSPLVVKSNNNSNFLGIVMPLRI